MLIPGCVICSIRSLQNLMFPVTSVFSIFCIICMYLYGLGRFSTSVIVQWQAGVQRNFEFRVCWLDKESVSITSWVVEVNPYLSIINPPADYLNLSKSTQWAPGLLCNHFDLISSKFQSWTNYKNHCREKMY